MRRRRRKVTLKRRIQCYAARLTVVAVFCMAGMLVFGASNFIINLFKSKGELPQTDKGESTVKAVSANITQKNERVEKTNTSDVLLLVNKTNPLSEEYDPKLHLLKNGQYVSEIIYDDLRDMIFATGDELDFIVASGYRTRAQQAQLFSEEMKKNELSGMDTESAYEDALKSVAPAGYSEHETGLSVDIVAGSNQRMDETQKDTAENKWLREHCSEYGFILRYPEGKEDVTGFMYESWHFRYVGKEAAKEITERGITLEEYLEEHLEKE